MRDIDLHHIMPYVNEQMLIGHHLGLKGKIKTLLAEKHPKALELKQLVTDLLNEGREKKTGLRQHLCINSSLPVQTEMICIFMIPKSLTASLKRSNFQGRRSSRTAPFLIMYGKVMKTRKDYIALFAVTAGARIREVAQQFKQEGDYLKMHAVQALALELAEGLAERAHQVIRDKWGFPDPVDFTMDGKRFQAKYQGQRYSFGYPACPNLEDQEKLFKLLQPEKIGIHLTEGFMMEPEASVSAIVVSHPDARYFNVH
ncbi:hypothetical protein BsIDN1_20240 [Bacillus safensis]|uniref:AdoMet activation domain-containing protein n=1 Tax=Bacillus safensis TaxID=561879 RepID=A0A5S9MA42_BACIA|nr:hypothetical protein BsIDN1_20240 [Bacillus safensis]